MEKHKIDSIRGYYQTSLDGLKESKLAYSHTWCREASEAILELLDEVEALPEYEYTIEWHHKPSGVQGRLTSWGEEGWGALEEANQELADQKARDRENGVDWQFEYNLLKRRLRGEIEKEGI